MSINVVVLGGRVVAQPDLRTTASGLPVTTIRLAVDRIVGKGKEKETDFIQLVLWRQTAEVACKYIKKGDPITVTGSIQTRQYEDKDGAKRTAFEVVVDRLELPPKGQREQGSKEPVVTVQLHEPDEDDLPF